MGVAGRAAGWVLCQAIAWGASPYTGAAACAECHREQYQKQSGSRHARALRPILESPLPRRLAERPLQERNGVSFEYKPSPKGLEVTARHAGEAATAVLEWAFGAGAQGITPVGRAGNIYFEHRISYYSQPQRPARTLGHPASPSPSATAALGMVQAPRDLYHCFNCHATGVQKGPDLSDLRPGVGCERCHGPGRAHITSPHEKTILNPGRFPAPAVVQICAECHRQAEPGKASAEPEREDPLTVRFQPIGLMASRCFQQSKTLSCLTCHDPHQDAHHDDDAFYTSRCLGCHATTPAQTASACRRAARENCLPCHMRRSSPAPYLTFVDHRIRVYPLPDVEKLLGAGQYQQALAELDQLPSRTARWHLLRSKAYDGLHDPARAVEEAQLALDLDPRQESLHLHLAQIFLTRNTPQPAFEILSEAQALFPDSLLVRLGKGLALKELLRYDEAEKELLECLRRRPDLALAFDALGSAYLSTKRFEDGLQAAERYRKNNPKDFRGYYYLAACRDGLKLEPPETEALLRHAIRLQPEFAASHALLGKLLLDGERAREAVASLEEAIRLRPDYSPPHYHLAMAYRRLGRLDDAERASRLFSELKDKERQPAPTLLYRRGPSREPPSRDRRER
jgi:tetratricopeptide (TPR) repeat protein